MQRQIRDFVSLYGQGRRLEALRCLFPCPDICLDDFPEEASLLINYAAAVAFEPWQCVGAILKEMLDYPDENHPNFMNMLHEDGLLLDEYKSKAPGIEKFISAKKHFYDNFLQDSDHLLLANPFFGLTYSSKEDLSLQLEKKPTGTPVIIVEAWDVDWSHLFQKIADRRVIWVFYDDNLFYRCLGMPGWVEEICNDQHILFVMNVYPVAQLLSQNAYGLRDLFPVVLSPPHLVAKAGGDIVDLLGRCIATLPDNLWQETTSANVLYQYGKILAFNNKTRFLGSRRCLTAQLKAMQENGAEPHRHFPVYEMFINDDINKQYVRYTRNSPRRKVTQHGKVSIAHIVPVIDDGSNHAPTVRLRNLLEHYNRDEYDISVICTEQFSCRGKEYALPLTHLSSWEKGKYSIAWMMSNKIEVYVDEGQDDFLSTAQNLNKLLAYDGVDVVIFHEAHPIHLLMATMIDAPYRIFFEHGRFIPLDFDCFDFFILSHQEEANRIGLPYVVANPKIAGKHTEENYHPLKRQDFLKKYSLPEQACLLTTLSNHLQSRLSVSMCQCIAKILQENPIAYYMPIGHWNNPARQMNIFQYYEVDHKVIHLPPQSWPLNVLNIMDLYLNEFPFGGSSAVIEAMAVGLPIVTMLVNQGSIDCREGAYLFGIQHAVCNEQDYYHKVNQLIQNPSLRKQWGNIARQQYKRNCCDSINYCFKHQSIIKRLIAR